MAIGDPKLGSSQSLWVFIEKRFKLVCLELPQWADLGLQNWVTTESIELLWRKDPANRERGKRK